VLLAAALLGTLGPGLFSRCSAVSPSGSLAVEFHKFGHFRTDEPVTVRLSARPEDQGRVSFWIDRPFLDDVSVEDVWPRPLEVRSESDRTIFVFAASGATVTVRFTFVPERPGRL